MKQRIYLGAFASIAICLALQNAILVKNNKEVREQRDLVVDKEFRQGDLVKRFGGVDLDGRFTEVEFGARGQNTLLIGFSAGCPASLTNLPNLRRLSRALDRARWRVVWVTRDTHTKARDFFRQNRIESQVLGELSCRNYNALGLRSVPRIVAVAPNGTVQAAWSGVLTREVWDEIFSYFLVPPDNQSDDSLSLEGLPGSS